MLRCLRRYQRLCYGPQCGSRAGEEVGPLEFPGDASCHEGHTFLLAPLCVLSEETCELRGKEKRRYFKVTEEHTYHENYPFGQKHFALIS